MLILTGVPKTLHTVVVTPLYGNNTGKDSTLYMYSEEGSEYDTVFCQGEPEVGTGRSKSAESFPHYRLFMFSQHGLPL